MGENSIYHSFGSNPSRLKFLNADGFNPFYYLISDRFVSKRVLIHFLRMQVCFS